MRAGQLRLLHDAGEENFEGKILLFKIYQSLRLRHEEDFSVFDGNDVPTRAGVGFTETSGIACGHQCPFVDRKGKILWGDPL